MGWCDDDLDTFRNIGEREVDALLIEELRCSAAFRRWMLSGALASLAVGELPGDGCALHSVHRSGEFDGQTDLLVRFTAAAGDAIEIYIENKVAAPFSDRTKSGFGQIERYLRHIDAEVKSGAISRGALLLVAPDAYLRSSTLPTDGRLITLSLDAIADWFEARSQALTSEHGDRMRHKALVLRCAIDGHRRGYSPVSDDRVTSLWDRYFQIASTEFPDLRLKPKKPGFGRDSYTAYFPCDARTPSGEAVSLAHVWERGDCDALLRGQEARLGDIKSRYSSLLDPDMRYRAAKGSIGVNIKVPAIRRFAASSEADAQIRTALSTIMRLRTWAHKNAQKLV